MKNYFTISILFMFFFLWGSHSAWSQSNIGLDRRALINKLSTNQMERFEKFLASPTAQAQDSISKFSDEEIILIWDSYKEGKSLSEQRIFWLIEAHLNRKADKIAASRLFYLYLALLLLGILFFVFIFIIYVRQKQIFKNISS